MTFADQISEAFPFTSIPQMVSDPSRPLISDRQDADHVATRSREDVDWWFLQKHADALYAMTREAFRYYLPRFIMLSMEPTEITPLFVSPIFQMLDPGPDATYWSDQFKDMWVGMSADQYDAIKAWIRFLASVETDEDEQAILARCFNTLELLSRISSESAG